MSANKTNPRKWSAEVTQNSDALDLEKNIFKSDDPTEIARSLKLSAERSNRLKASPFRSAMSMLSFYLNRAGTNLSASQKTKLETAKSKLREAFERKAK